MMPSERKQHILTILKERREVSVQALAGVLDEPSANIRRDLRELEKENRILRRHGRAIFRSNVVPAAVEPEGDLDPTFLDDLVDETARILDETRNLFLSGGAVMVRVARKLSGKTIATNDLTLAMAAAQSDNDVTLVGREVDNRTLTLRSASFEQEFSQFWFDAAVVETDGIDEKNLWVARQTHALLSALLPRADSFVAVARSSALGRKGDRVAGPLTNADVIVIDKGASEAARQALAAANAEVRVAGEGGEGQAFGYDQVGNVFVFKRGGGRFAQGRGSALAVAAEHDSEPGPDDLD